MIIHRDYNRSEKDDFTLNVSGKIGELQGATPLYSEDGKIVAWKIAYLYE